MAEPTLNGVTSAFSTSIDDILKQQQIAQQAQQAATGYEFSPTIIQGVDQTKVGNIMGNTSGGLITDDSSWFNSSNLSAAAGLASALTQAIPLPLLLKDMRLRGKSMQHNLDTAKQEQARRNKNISGFNSFSNIKGS